LRAQDCCDAHVQHIDEMRGEVAAVIATIPEKALVRVCEGGADENLFATLAVSVQKLIDQRDEAGRACIKMGMEIGSLRKAAETVTCAFCGAPYPRGTPRHGDGSLAEHIKVCKEHPMRELERTLNELQCYVGLLEDEVRNAVRYRAVHGPMACNSEQADHLASQSVTALRESAAVHAKHMTSDVRKLQVACDAIGPWMSAAQDDPKVCHEMKEAIEIFFKNFGAEGSDA
jgi:hypothetical protein